MKFPGVLTVAVIVMVASAIVASEQSANVASVSCGVVIPGFDPCRAYITKVVAEPSKTCCSGVLKINNICKTRQDHVEACQCIKRALPNGGYDPNRIPLIPKICGLSFPLPAIGKNTDCNKVVPDGF